MTILDIKDKLPLKVKLNNNFTLEESFDVNTILYIKGYLLDGEYDNESCYKVFVSALKEDQEHNNKIAIPDWYNDKTKKFDLTYYQCHKDTNGHFEDTIYVMDNENCFDLIEEFPDFKFVEWIGKNSYFIETNNNWYCKADGSKVAKSTEELYKKFLDGR